MAENSKPNTNDQHLNTIHEADEWVPLGASTADDTLFTEGCKMGNGVMVRVTLQEQQEDGELQPLNVSVEFVPNSKIETSGSGQLHVVPRTVKQVEVVE